MKKFIFVFLFLVTKLYAYDGVVIVLEAPLLKEAKLSSTVLQVLRKGNRVYIPNEIGNILATEEELPEFIQTYDRVGNIAYIPSKYIKIVTHDLSESRMPINYPGHDTTDYRLEEPIPSTYPFDNTSFLRASLSFSAGSNIKAPYDYNSAFTHQNFSSETGMRLIVTRKVAFDNYDRYYFGLVGAINTTNNELDFTNLSHAKENRSVFKIGPIITFDAFKNNRYRLSLGTGFTYNIHKSYIRLSNENIKGGLSEERLFSGFSLSPFANTIIQWTEVFPGIDFIGGADLNFYLPHSQKSSDQIEVPELWANNSPNQIESGFKPQVSLFLGIQVKY